MRIRWQRSVTSAVPFCPSAAPLLDASEGQSSEDLDLVANARAVPVAFDVAFVGGDVAAAHGTRR